MNKNIPETVKLEYLEWLLTPPAERDPKTKPEMAAQLDVSLRSLYNWENSDLFQEKLSDVKRKWGARFYGEILGRLMDVVQNGTDRDAGSATRVLLGHLVVDDVKESDKVSVNTESLEKLKAALKAEGYTVIEDARK
jgi:hypothetical protein